MNTLLTNRPAQSALMTYLLMFLLFPSLSGCTAGYNPAYTSPPVAIMAGEVVSAQAGTVAQLVKDAAAAVPTTRIFLSTDGTNLLLAKSYPDIQQWMFWGVRLKDLTQLAAIKSIIAGGQFTGNSDFSSLAAALERSGWTKVGVEKIPPALIAAAKNLTGFVSMYSGVMPTFILAPAWLREDGTFEWWVDPFEIVRGETIKG